MELRVATACRVGSRISARPICRPCPRRPRSTMSCSNNSSNSSDHRTNSRDTESEPCSLQAVSSLSLSPCPPNRNPLRLRALPSRSRVYFTSFCVMLCVCPAVFPCDFPHTRFLWLFNEKQQSLLHRSRAEGLERNRLSFSATTEQRMCSANGSPSPAPSIRSVLPAPSCPTPQSTQHDSPLCKLAIASSHMIFASTGRGRPTQKLAALKVC